MVWQSLEPKNRNKKKKLLGHSCQIEYHYTKIGLLTKKIVLYKKNNPFTKKLFKNDVIRKSGQFENQILALLSEKQLLFSTKGISKTTNLIIRNFIKRHIL